MERFELSHRLSQSTPLAGEPLEPLGYICLCGLTSLVAQAKLAEREGFEPPVPFDITGFQDQRLKPLGHLSIRPIPAASTALGCAPRLSQSQSLVVQARPSCVTSKHYYSMEESVRQALNRRNLLFSFFGASMRSELKLPSNAC